MTSRDFCYWLQGYFEINGEPSEALSLDPSIAKPGSPEAVKLDEIHSLRPQPPKIGGVGPEGQIYRC